MIKIKNTEKRKSNIELLRILAIVFILAAHWANHGVLDYIQDGRTLSTLRFNNVLCAMIYPGGEIGVAIFFMITGFFGIDNYHLKYRKVAAEVAFYGIFIGVISFICLKITGGGISQEEYLEIAKTVLLPTTGGAWWFVVNYFYLILISPSLNKLFSQTGEKSYFKGIVICWVFLYIVGYLLSAPFLNLQRAILFYLIGGFIKKYVKIESNKKRFLFLVGFAFFWILYGSIKYIDLFYFGDLNILVKGGCVFLRFLSVPLSATMIFIFLCSFDFSSILVNYVASSVFGIYLISDHPIVRGWLWDKVLKVYSCQYMSKLFPFYGIITIIIVFMVCLIIDTIRKWIFNRMKLYW